MYFNEPVNSLPESLEYIKFGHKFDQPVDLLPKNLKYLSFGSEFSHSIDNLPDSIEYLFLGDVWIYNCEVGHKLPNNLKCLELPDSNRYVDNLPIGLQELIIHNSKSDTNDTQIKLPFGCKLIKR
jgi:hypothetical protein